MSEAAWHKDALLNTWCLASVSTTRVFPFRRIAGASPFSGGAYLLWALGGHVHFRITNTGPVNAVLSGLFFG